MHTTINEAGKLVLDESRSLLLNSHSAGKVFILNGAGETLTWQKIEAGENIIDMSLLPSGAYAIRIENKNNYTLSSFEIR